MTVLEHDWYPVAVPANVEIGEGSWLYSSFAFLHYRSLRPTGLRIGRSSGIYIDTLFDLGPDAEVVIGDHCTLAGPIFCTSGRVTVGDRVLFSSRVLVADHHCAVPPPPGPLTGLEPEVTVVIEDDVWVGTGATILAGARLGAGAIVGAASVVRGEVPPRAIVAGDPAGSWDGPDRARTLRGAVRPDSAASLREPGCEGRCSCGTSHPGSLGGACIPSAMVSRSRSRSRARRRRSGVVGVATPGCGCAAAGTARQLATLRAL